MANRRTEPVHFSSSCTRWKVVAVGAIVIVIGLAVGLGVGLRETSDDAELYKSEHGEYPSAAVTSDDKICSDIGTDIMARHHGNAIDAGIATLLCVGVLCSHSAGIGGGSLATVYIKKTNEWKAVNFRETAPLSAKEMMLANRTLKRGARFIGVPGEISGALALHARYGTLPWKTLVMPTVRLLRDGFPLSKSTWKAVNSIRDLYKKPGFKMFFNADNSPKSVGSTIKMTTLATTFERIAENGTTFYDGDLANDIVQDIKGAKITLEDLKQYKTEVMEPSSFDLPGLNMTMYSVPPPGSGPILMYILSILSGYKLNPDSIANDKGKILTYHRIVEAMKFGYAKRSGLGDNVHYPQLLQNLTSLSYGEETRRLIDDQWTHSASYYTPFFSNVKDEGTSHLGVVDSTGNAISITTSINQYFGSLVVGNRTGIIFNNGMSDFSTPGELDRGGVPPSPYNFIRPGKRPMSSMCPTIVMDNDKGGLRLVTGAAGGYAITSAVALNMIDILWFKMSALESIDRPRFHHQLVPNEIKAEDDYPKAIKAGLEAKGHKFGNPTKSVVNTLSMLHDEIEAVADFRKGGAPSGF